MAFSHSQHSTAKTNTVKFIKTQNKIESLVNIVTQVAFPQSIQKVKIQATNV